MALKHSTEQGNWCAVSGCFPCISLAVQAQAETLLHCLICCKGPNLEERQSSEEGHGPDETSQEKRCRKPTAQAEKKFRSFTLRHLAALRAGRGGRLQFRKALNIKEPRPLRDDTYPDGFPWLCGSDKIRTEVANLVYEHTVLIAQAAIRLEIAVTIENPADSLMWKTSPFLQLFQQLPQLKFVTFHNCAHGGVRDKLTSFATNKSWFDSLALLCDKQHTHAPWTPTVIAGKVHTEAAYPEILCQRIVLAKVLQLGALETDTLEKHVKFEGKSLNRVVIGAMPRERHVKPLLSEFDEYINVILHPQCDS